MLLPGVALYVAGTRPTWLRSRWPYLGLALAILAYGNVLIENLSSSFKGLELGRTAQAHYAAGEVLSPGVYGARLVRLLELLTNSLGGLLSESDPLVGLLDSPVVGGVTLLLVAALWLSARRGNWLPGLVAVSAALLTPLILPIYQAVVPKERYLGALLPLCYAAISALLVDGFDAAGRLGRRWGGGRATLLRGAIAVLTLAAIVVPPVGLMQYYELAQQQGRTDAPTVSAVRALQAAWRPGETILFDRDLASPYTLGGGRMLRTLLFAGMVYGWPTDTIDLTWASATGAPDAHGLLVIQPANEALASQSYQLEPIAAAPGPGSLLEIFHVFGASPLDSGQLPSSARTEPFVAGVRLPTALAFAPDGRLFFAEMLEGRIRIVSQGVLQQEPFAVLPTTRGRNQGLLGLALDPDFAADHWVYAFYSEADARNRPLRNRVVRFTERDGRATEPTPIVDDLPVNRTGFFSGGHNSGRLVFGPDGKLYIATGEMAHRSTAEDPAALNGKILRVNPDGSIPEDNPFPGLPTYAVGFNDIGGMAFDPSTGQLYVADRGTYGHDELDVVRPGHDYGYPGLEGHREPDQDDSQDLDDERVEAADSAPAPDRNTTLKIDDPIWDSGDERLVATGLTLYRGSLFPAYRGNLFFCALTSGALERVELGGPTLDRVVSVAVISRQCRLDVAQGPDDGLYFSDAANIYRLVP
jgi:glucose/arabinose dehydrogenase